MKIGAFRRFFRKDFVGSPSGGWFDQFLGSLNLFTDPVITALRNGLTYSDNFAVDIKTLKVTSDTPLNVGVRALPTEVRIQSCEGAMVTGWAWEPVKNDLITITARFDDKKSHQTTIIIYY